MSCREMEPELVGYHFGVISDELRQHVEEHLVECAHCIRAFVAIKRDIETADFGPSPSPAARQRLRLAVAEELGIARSRPAQWSWWERPLAFGFAGLAVLLAILTLSVLSSRPGSMPHGLRHHGAVSRPGLVQPP